MAKMPPINRRPFKSVGARGTELVPHPRTRDATRIADRARVLRADATGAERILWTALRSLKAQGFHFRRQAPIGPYIADFACKSAKVIVELDGSQHGLANDLAYDEVRTAFLSARGHRVLRFWNGEVLDHRDGVIESILRALSPTRPPAADDLPMLGR
ncbi:MAG TPA: endonuclease domain-containing protein [Rhizomicrobium sp.]